MYIYLVFFCIQVNLFICMIIFVKYLEINNNNKSKNKRIKLYNKTYNKSWQKRYINYCDYCNWAYLKRHGFPISREKEIKNIWFICKVIYKDFVNKVVYYKNKII